MVLFGLNELMAIVHQDRQKENEKNIYITVCNTFLNCSLFAMNPVNLRLQQRWISCLIFIIKLHFLKSFKKVFRENMLQKLICNYKASVRKVGLKFKRKTCCSQKYKLTTTQFFYESQMQVFIETWKKVLAEQKLYFLRFILNWIWFNGSFQY